MLFSIFKTKLHSYKNRIPTTILLYESDSNWKTDSCKFCLENGL